MIISQQLPPFGWWVQIMFDLVSPGSQGIPVMSPNQRLRGVEDYGFSADIWSLGLCVYELASGGKGSWWCHGVFSYLFLGCLGWTLFLCFCFLLFSFLTLFLSGDVWLASAIETDKKTRYWCDMFNDLGLFYGVFFPSLLLGPEDQRPWQQLMVTTTNHSYTIS